MAGEVIPALFMGLCMYNRQKVTAVIPALNESEAIAGVVSGLLGLQCDGKPLVDEVIVGDNGSSDDTVTKALAAGAQVVQEQRKGYGWACKKAISASSGKGYFVFVDGDASVAVSEVVALLDSLDENTLVIGARQAGQSYQDKSMTWAQRVGTALVCKLVSYLWSPITDVGPFRAIHSYDLARLNMRGSRYQWTVEMQIKALQHGIRVVEVPVSSLRRKGRSKISGTVRGTIGAGLGMLSMVVERYLVERLGLLRP